MRSKKTSEGRGLRKGINTLSNRDQGGFAGSWRRCEGTTSAEARAQRLPDKRARP